MDTSGASQIVGPALEADIDDNDDACDIMTATATQIITHGDKIREGRLSSIIHNLTKNRERTGNCISLQFDKIPPHVH